MIRLMQKIVFLRRWPLAVVMAIGLALGIASTTVPAGASTLTSVVWDTQGDFETNASTTGTPTNRLNIDTTTSPGDVKIGVTKDFITTATITCVANNKIYSTGVDRTTIAVIDAANKTLLRTISLPGRAAGVIYNTAHNKLYVGQYNDNKVSVIDVSTDTIIYTLTSGTAGNGAYAAVYNPTNNKVYIANTGDQTVTVLDGVTDSALVSLPVVAGATTAAFDAVADKVYFTSKANQFVTIIDGVSDQVQDVGIDPPVNLLGGQTPGNVGLRVDAQLLGVTSANAMRLSWTHEPLGAGQKMLFQVRTAPDVIALDSAVYTGPDGTSGTWYETPGGDGTETTADLNLPFSRWADIQVQFVSDGLGTPVLHSVILEYVSYPDLIVSGVTVSPSTVASGSTVTISATVQNRGQGAAGSSNAAFHLVANGTSYPLGTLAVPALEPGQSVTISLTATVPSLPAGSYPIQVCADPDNAIAETDETNNCAESTLNVTYPDLVTTSVSGPATATIGASIPVSSTVTNQGGVAAGTFKVGLYLTRNGTDYFLGDRTVASLAAGGTSQVSTTVTIPTIPTGAYTFKACADYTNMVSETDETNNCATGGGVNISSVQADLVILPGSVSGSVANGKFTYSVTVKNQGTNAVTAENRTGIYLSTDASITASDTMVNLATNYSIPGGASVTFTGTVNVPMNMTGTYYVGAIADYDNRIAEYDETNNSGAGNQVTITNDLIVVPGSVSGSVIANGKLTYTATIKNIGNGVIGSENYGVNLGTGIFLSTDTNITIADIGAGYLGYGLGIPGGTSVTLTGTSTLPMNVTGTFYVGAIVNYDNRVPEPDRTNNSSDAGNQVTITNDLIVVPGSVSGSVANGKLTYTATIKNTGNGVIGSENYGVNLGTGIFLSTDTNITSADIGAGYLGYGLGIPGGNFVTLTGTSTLPMNVTGTFYVGAIVNYDNRVPEPDRTNNSGVGNQVTLP